MDDVVEKIEKRGRTQGKEDVIRQMLGQTL